MAKTLKSRWADKNSSLKITITQRFRFPVYLLYTRAASSGAISVSLVLSASRRASGGPAPARPRPRRPRTVLPGFFKARRWSIPPSCVLLLARSPARPLSQFALSSVSSADILLLRHNFLESTVGRDSSHSFMCLNLCASIWLSPRTAYWHWRQW